MNINKLTEDDIGRWVVYIPEHGMPEIGRIKTFNNTYVFVVYKCNNLWDEYQRFTGQATYPDNLRFIKNFNKGEDYEKISRQIVNKLSASY